jgi:hypothetical protein
MLGRLLVASPVVVWAFGCASPTLPLPPPQLVTVTQVDSDHVSLSGQCGSTPPSAILIVLNENESLPLDQRGASTLTDPSCGKWDVLVFAHAKDTLAVWYEERGQPSQSTYVVVP